MSHNDTSLHPQNSDATYPGCANPTPSNGIVIVDIPSQEYTSASSAEIKDEATKKDVVEAQPGLIESTELAPLGDEKVAAGEGNVAAGQGLVSQAQSLGKQAYEAVVVLIESDYAAEAKVEKEESTIDGL